MAFPGVGCFCKSCPEGRLTAGGHALQTASSLDFSDESPAWAGQMSETQGLAPPKAITYNSESAAEGRCRIPVARVVNASFRRTGFQIECGVEELFE